MTAQDQFLKKAFFNVTEEPTFRQRMDPKFGIVHDEVPKFKYTIDSSTDNVIACVRSPYKIVQNREIIEPILEYLDKTDIKWEIDLSNSYVGPDKLHMRLVYPEITIPDDSKEGCFVGHGLFNAHDGKGSVKALDYVMRLVCTNGLLRTRQRNMFFQRHTAGFNLEVFKENLTSLLEEAPQIGERIALLRTINCDGIIKERVKDISTKGMYDYMISEIGGEHADISNINKWQLLNILTYYISHEMNQRAMAMYQYKVGKLFGV